MTYKYQLGDVVKDKITSYKGMVVCRSEWIYGCIRYVLQSRKLKDGVPVQNHVCDEGSIELISPAGEVVPQAAAGGPRDDPDRGHTVSR